MLTYEAWSEANDVEDGVADHSRYGAHDLPHFVEDFEDEIAVHAVHFQPLADTLDLGDC